MRTVKKSANGWTRRIALICDAPGCIEEVKWDVGTGAQVIPEGGVQHPRERWLTLKRGTTSSYEEKTIDYCPTCAPVVLDVLRERGLVNAGTTIE